MDQEASQYYVEQDPESGNFCVYKPDGTKVDEFGLRRDAVKAAAKLNAEESKEPSSAENAETKAKQKSEGEQ